MRDYSIFDQLTDKQFEGVEAAVRNLVNSDERGFFGYISARDMVKSSTDVISGIINNMVKAGMMACEGGKYKDAFKAEQEEK